MRGRNNTKGARGTGAAMRTIQEPEQNGLKTWVQNTGPALWILCDVTLSAVSVRLPLFVVIMISHTSCYLLRAYYFPVTEVRTFFYFSYRKSLQKNAMRKQAF